MSTGQPYTRRDVSLTSGEDTCAAWLYLPTGVTSPPVVILGHGLGATREMRLDAFAERFARAGIAALAFTYRHFGDSGGQPRQLLSIKRQLADWDAAIAWVKNRRDVDGTRIAVWGSSFGGGHSITVASRHPELKAAVAQCPFTDGLASALALGLAESLKVCRQPQPPAAESSTTKPGRNRRKPDGTYHKHRGDNREAAETSSAASSTTTSLPRPPTTRPESRHASARRTRDQGTEP